MYNVTLATGTGYSAENPGGIPGDWLADPWAADAIFRSRAREFNCARLMYHDFPGFKPSQIYPASCYYTALPIIRSFIDSLTITPDQEIWTYIGLGVHPTTPDLYNLDITTDYAIATPAFMEQAYAPFLRKGFTGFFIDAAFLENPDVDNTNPQKNILLQNSDRNTPGRYPRIRVGGETFAHSASGVHSGQFDLYEPYIYERPYLTTYRVWDRFYRDTVTQVPPGCELHVCPQPFDLSLPPPYNNFTFETFLLLRSRGFVVSPYHDFKSFYPTLWAQMLPYLIEDSTRKPVNRIIRPSYGGSLEIRQ